MVALFPPNCTSRVTCSSRMVGELPLPFSLIYKKRRETPPQVSVEG
ncbi:MAG: hypothetical protein V7K86_15125 [Nostoc sp.]